MSGRPSRPNECLLTSHGSALLCDVPPGFVPVCGQEPLNGLPYNIVSDITMTWPWMVSVQNDDIHVCSGTLLSKDFIITSAECFSSSPLNSSDWNVFLGYQSLNHNFLLSQAVANIMLSNLTTVPNMAVLELEEPVEFGDHIQPMCGPGQPERLPPQA